MDIVINRHETELSIHDAHLTIINDFPENSLSMTLDTGTGAKVRIHFADLEEWLRLHAVIPKHPDYRLSFLAAEPCRDPDCAEEWILLWAENRRRDIAAKAALAAKINEVK